MNKRQAAKVNAAATISRAKGIEARIPFASGAAQAQLVAQARRLRNAAIASLNA